MTANERDATPVALVTGANRGIGFEVCRQLAQEGMKVFLGARDREKAESAVQKLSGEGLDVVPRTVDVSEAEGAGRLADELEEFGRLDVLDNNAGIDFDYTRCTSSADLGMVHETMETNLFGAWRSCEALLPLLRASKHGRIVNVSSEAGSSFTSPVGMASAGGVLPAYTVSKAALNTFTVKLAAELKDTGIPSSTWSVRVSSQPPRKPRRPAAVRPPKERRAWCGRAPSPTMARQAASSATESLCPGECASRSGPDAARAEQGDPCPPDATGPGASARPRRCGAPCRPPDPGAESPLHRPLDPAPGLPTQRPHPS